MKYTKEDIVQFVEPVYRFSMKRLHDPYDAEDLTSEIMLYVLDGLDKYDIHSLEGWVWRIAHNRYARFIQRKKQNQEILMPDYALDMDKDYTELDVDAVVESHEKVFNFLHTLSRDYRHIFVDYYLGGLPVKKLAARYGLSSSTIKWRLNIGRQKIRERMDLTERDDFPMDRIYKRLNWNTKTCNGNMNPDAYLHTQLARAICESVYEKPLTVEDISLQTGIPALYIEDELPRLIYGDAVEQTGSKYAADFIILRMCDKARMQEKFTPYIKEIADFFESILSHKEKEISRMPFYGAGFGIARLGYIGVQASLRSRIWQIKGQLGLASEAFPPRKDGGYGWFVVEETEDEREWADDYAAGCNTSSRNGHYLYYFHIGKYFDFTMYERLNDLHISGLEEGHLPSGSLSQEQILRLMQVNLLRKEDGNRYSLNFPCFTPETFHGFLSVFDDLHGAEKVDKALKILIQEIYRDFKAFTPKRLESQIPSWLSCYVGRICGLVIEELINRRCLTQPQEDEVMVNGVFHITGPYMAV